jgi:sugar lactone lactonase YvrE
MKYFTHLLSICILAACGGGGGGESAPSSVVSSYSLGGSIGGLGGATGLTLVNGTETLSIGANATAFTFVNKLTQSASYNVTVTSQPAGLDCSVNDGRGTMPAANVTTIAVKCVALPTAALFAGSLGGAGSVDGLGSAARFNFPSAITRDSSGNLYVAEARNYTIRKITPTGVVSTLAGIAGSCGSADGAATAAKFCRPSGIAIDSADNLYVADGGNNSIRKITPVGVVSTLVSGLNSPNQIAVDNIGNIYVTELEYNDPYVNSQTVRKITPAGIVSTLAGTYGAAGSADGIGPNARFSQPSGLTTDSAGNVYVYDLFNSAIRKITPARVVTTLVVLADNGFTLDTAGGLAFDGIGNLYVTQNRTIRKITPAGTVTTLAGSTASGWADGVGAAAAFDQPTGITTDSAGNIYVTDTGNFTIRKVTPTGSVSTLAGEADTHGDRNGAGAAARFSYITGITADRTGNVYAADAYNGLIRKITPAGLVSTLAGTGARADVDGSSAMASFNLPYGVTADSDGNLYVAEYNTIRKITPAGLVSTLAGTAGMGGSADGMGAAARFTLILGIATDSAGNLYATDAGNNTIRKITPGGVVSTLAGTGFYGAADGIGTAASFSSPRGITIDNAGNLYVVEYDSNRIRKITPAGVVSTLAGTIGAPGHTDGVGAVARFNKPEGIAIDSAGNLYVADTFNYAIRKITPAGIVSTLVGVPGRDFFAAGPPASLKPPSGVAISGNNLYIAMVSGIAVVTIQP